MTRARRIGLIAAAIIAAFLVGFFWQFVRAEQLSRALDAAQRQLAVTRAEATLGAAVIEAQRGSYETSRGLASDFFTGVQRNVAQQQGGTPPAFTTILNQRDSVITLLSRSDSQAVGMLSRMFVEYRTAVGR
ncbi:MAG TPA: hypothetical protein VF166_09110 [Gemmatimonadaceae bacterium]